MALVVNPAQSKMFGDQFELRRIVSHHYQASARRCLVFQLPPELKKAHV